MYYVKPSTVIFQKNPDLHQTSALVTVSDISPWPRIVPLNWPALIPL